MPTLIMSRARPNAQQIKTALATGTLPVRGSNDGGNRRKCNGSILDRKKPKNDSKYLVYWAVFFVHRRMGRWGVDTMFIGIEMMFVCNDTVRRHGSCPRKRDNTLFVTWQW